MAIVLLIQALFSGGINPQAQTAQPAKTIVIHVKKYAFSPNTITLKKDEPVKLVLISDDVRHGLAVRALGLRAEILPGHPANVIVTPAEVGDFPGTCSAFCGSGHHDMAFTVHVVE